MCKSCAKGYSYSRDCIKCRARLIVKINDLNVRRQMIEGSGFDVNELKKEVGVIWKK